jgi:hypothetical protein
MTVGVKEKPGTVSQRRPEFTGLARTRAQKTDPGQTRNRRTTPEFLFPNYADLMIRVNPEVEKMGREPPDVKWRLPMSTGPALPAPSTPRDLMDGAC